MEHRDRASFRAPAGFVIKQLLGRGGYGSVYEATDPEGRSVALKHLHRVDPQAVDRFKQEFELVKSHPHPRLAELYGMYFEEGQWFYSMQLLKGVPFNAWVGAPAKTLMPTTDDDGEAEVATEDPDETRTSSTGPSWNLDVSRLRDALRQLVEGIIALHERGILHCDLKPSNIIVTDVGKLYLVDFGIARMQDGAATDSFLPGTTFGAAPGTPAYMSPEQALGSSLTLASDWYAVGVILFEALSGQLPFFGTRSDMLKARLYRTPRDPRTLRSNLPDDLCDLCMALLKRDPFERPNGYRIGQLAGLRSSRAASPRALSGGTLLGRDEELRALEEAFELSLTGRTVLCHVHGGSGLGKTALVQRFVTQLAMNGQATALSGRCFERNAMAFKALDELLEGLARFLNGLPELEAARLMPRDVKSLTRLFPQLGRLSLLEDLGGRPAAEDSQELRRRAFGALRELLSRITDVKPLVLVIDDAHWGDADSAECLKYLLAPPEPPPLLLIATSWSQGTDEHEFLNVLTVAPTRDARRTSVSVPLGPLDQTAAVQLALSLLPPESRTEERARRIARESDSSPFLIAELVRAAATHQGDTKDLSLADVIQQHVSSLQAPERTILFTLCAHEGGLTERDLEQLTALPDNKVIEHVHALRERRLVVGISVRNTRMFQIAHLRLREAIWAQVVPEEKQAIHERLGHLLESRGGEPEETAFHYLAAGDSDSGYRFTMLAGDKAARRSALSSAVALYQQAMTLAPAEQGSVVLGKLAEAMGRAGMGPAAARLHLALAAQADNKEEALTKAGEQYLLAGLTREAVETLRPVLRARGLAVPRTKVWPGLKLMYRRSRLLARLERENLETARDVGDTRSLETVDLAWTLANGFAGIDVFLSAHYTSIALFHALQVGEPSRIARTLSLEAILIALEQPGKPSLPAAMLDHAARFAERSKSNHARGWVTGARAILALSQADLETCEELGRKALSLLRESPQLSFREIGTLSVWFWLYPSYLLGKIDQIADEAPAVAREAAARGDRYTLSTVRTYVLPLLHLMRDEPDSAAREADEGLSAWGGDDWLNQHWAHLHSHCCIDLYTGKTDSILHRIQGAQAQMKAAFHLEIQAIQADMLYLEGRAWLERTPSSEVHRAVKKRIKGLRKTPEGLAKIYADVLEAGLTLKNDPDGAEDALEKLHLHLEGMSMTLHAAATRLRAAQLRKDDAGIEAARQALLALSVRNPERTTDLLIPRAAS